MKRDNDEKLAGLTQSTFLDQPLVRTFELFEEIFETQQS